jgi:hypothetical protein
MKDNQNFDIRAYLISETLEKLCVSHCLKTMSM